MSTFNFIPITVKRASLFWDLVSTARINLNTWFLNELIFTEFQELEQLINFFLQMSKKKVFLEKKKCFELKVQSFKLHNNKYVITSTQIKNITIFAFIAILVFKLLSLESRLLFKKIGNHTGKLLQNYK